MKRGLFLDLDGTLADTLPALRAVYHEFLAGFGVAGSEAEFQSLNGPALPEIVRSLRHRHALPGAEETLYSLYRDGLAAVHSRALPAPGARGVLERARARGWTVAVVSSNNGASTRAWLGRTGLGELVSAVVGGDEVERAKPDPQPYRRALALTGCEPGLSLAVEDGAQGALAALGAGLNTWMLGDATAAALEGHALFRGCLPDFQAVARLL